MTQGKGEFPPEAVNQPIRRSEADIRSADCLGLPRVDYGGVYHSVWRQVCSWGEEKGAYARGCQFKSLTGGTVCARNSYSGDDNA